MKQQQKIIYAFLGVALFGGLLWLGLDAYSKQVDALNLKKTDDQIKVAEKVNEDTGYILVRTDGDSQLLADILAQEGYTKDKELPELGIVRIKVDTDLYSTREAADKAESKIKEKKPNKKNGEAYAEPDIEYSQSLIPDDTQYGSQWHLPLINAPGAWDTTTGTGVTIGVADGGVDCGHPDIIANCVAGWNFYDNNSITNDVNGHGTMVAGMAAAAGNNARQVAGVGFNLKLMPLRVADASGMASASNIAAAVTYAADRGVKAVNLSFAAGGSSTIWNAGKYIRSKGGLLVVASGNTGTVSGSSSSPDIIVVGSTTDTDVRSSFSTFGSFVDLTAPGSSVVTLSAGGGTTTGSGTSFSTPVVTGLAGLLYSVKPGFTASQVESFLVGGAKDLGAAGWDAEYGWGRVNALASVDLAKAASAGDSTPPSVPTSLVASALSSSSVKLTWTASTDNIAVAGYQVFRGATLVGSTSSASYADTGLTPLTAYSYTVKAYDGANNFSAASSPATVTTPEASLAFTYGPSIGTKTATTAFVGWGTNIAASAVIEYGLTSSLGSSLTDATVALSHSTQLTGLKANTLYYYRVKVATPDGKSVMSSISSFRTRKK